jgi:hypothetical protein
MTRMRMLGASAAVVAALTIAVPGSAQHPGRDASLARSAALVAAPAARGFDAPADVPAQTARAVAGGIAGAIPLPPGGSFDGVRWEQAGGVFTTAEIALVLQYNAACQWLRAWRDGRETPTSGLILRDVPSWPAWRDSETGAFLAQVAADVRAGGGPSAVALLSDCDAAHDREVTYAAGRGLTPAR